MWLWLIKEEDEMSFWSIRAVLLSAKQDTHVFAMQFVKLYSFV